MPLSLSKHFRCPLLSSLCLLALTGCGYQRPDGQWIPLDASSIQLAAVQLDTEAIDPNDAAICEEARNEIYHQLLKKLPKKIAPLTLATEEASTGKSADTAALEIRITGCDIDVDQSGGRFSYYLTLPVKVKLTLNEKNLLNHEMDTCEQVSVSMPAPEFEFTFAEPVARTLLLFDGKRLWLPAN